MNSGRMGVAIFAAVAADGGALLKFPATLSGSVSLFIRPHHRIRATPLHELFESILGCNILRCNILRLFIWNNRE